MMKMIDLKEMNLVYEKKRNALVVNDWRLLHLIYRMDYHHESASTIQIIAFILNNTGFELVKETFAAIRRVLPLTISIMDSIFMILNFHFPIISTKLCGSHRKQRNC